MVVPGDPPTAAREDILAARRRRPQRAAGNRPTASSESPRGARADTRFTRVDLSREDPDRGVNGWIFVTAPTNEKPPRWHINGRLSFARRRAEEISPVIPRADKLGARALQCECKFFHQLEHRSARSGARTAVLCYRNISAGSLTETQGEKARPSEESGNHQRHHGVRRELQKAFHQR